DLRRLDGGAAGELRPVSGVPGGRERGDGGPQRRRRAGHDHRRGRRRSPHVKVFDGFTLTLLASFYAFDPGFLGGITVAAGDVTGDGVPDLIVGALGGAGPHVKVFDGRTFAEVRSFYAFDKAFAGGVHVAAGDVNHDGFADVIVGAGPGGGGH